MSVPTGIHLPPYPLGELTLLLSTSNCLSCNSKMNTFEAPTRYTLPLVPCSLVKLLGWCKLSATQSRSRGESNASALHGESRLALIAAKSKFYWAWGRLETDTCLYILTQRISLIPFSFSCASLLTSCSINEFLCHLLALTSAQENGWVSR